MFQRNRASALQDKHVLFAIAAAFFLLMVAVVPAYAITFGEPDGSAHPNVGSIVIRIPDEGLFQVCSGTLIDEAVFLTASHCTYGLEDEIADIPGGQILVTFDPVIDENGTFYTGELVTNPNYNPVIGENDAADTGDVAVILLDQAPGIEPASLPTLGLLDQLKANRTLKSIRFTAVGYGSVRDTKGGGWKGIDADNMERRRVDQSFLSLTKAWLTLSMNFSTGSGGTCYGDSGGPHFVHMNGSETDVVVSVTVTGDAVCRASDKTYRVDTAGARVFLDQYVDLP